MKNIRIHKNKHSALKIDMGPHFDLKSIAVLYFKWKRLDSWWDLHSAVLSWLPSGCQGQKEHANCSPIFKKAQTLMKHWSIYQGHTCSWHNKKVAQREEEDKIQTHRHNPFFLHSIAAFLAFNTQQAEVCELPPFLRGTPGFRGAAVNLFPALIPCSACFQ